MCFFAIDVSLVVWYLDSIYILYSITDFRDFFMPSKSKSLV